MYIQVIRDIRTYINKMEFDLTIHSYHINVFVIEYIYIQLVVVFSIMLEVSREEIVLVSCDVLCTLG